MPKSKEPVKTQAILYNLKNIEDIQKLVAPGTAHSRGGRMIVNTKFAAMEVSENEYVVKEGETFSAVSKDEFEKSHKADPANKNHFIKK